MKKLGINWQRLKKALRLQILKTLEWDKEFRSWNLKKEELTKVLRYAEIVGKITTKKKIIIGVAEHIIQNTEERCGGVV